MTCVMTTLDKPSMMPNVVATSSDNTLSAVILQIIA